MVRIITAVFALSAMAGAVSARPTTQPVNGVTILTGDFGTLGAKRKLSIVAPLQRLCGQGPSCSVFCSETSFGRYNLGRRPICRVTYRCPDQATRAVEAAKEELILLRCDEADEETEASDAVGAIQDGPPVDHLRPPPYVPPRS